MKIHVHNSKHKTDYSRYKDAEWAYFHEKSNVHNNRLIGGDEMFESVLPLLKNLKHPSLLIKGQFDPVTCDKQMEKFQADVSFANVVILNNSGHFPHSEEPDSFLRSVVEFLK